MRNSSHGLIAYQAAIAPTSVGKDEEMASMQAFALMALVDACPHWSEPVGDTPEAIVVTVRDAAVISAKLAITYRALGVGHRDDFCDCADCQGWES